MNDQIRQQLLNEAIRIGDNLLALAEVDKNGMSWKTMAVDMNNKTVFWKKFESLYSGVSGIVLYFLALYRITTSENYLNAAIEGMRWVEYSCQNNPTDHYAFFTGRLGVVYCFLKMAEVTKKNDYLEHALELIKAGNDFIESSCPDDLLNGSAGKILALLHLHAETQDRHVLGIINRITEKLIRHAEHGPAGLYWDRSAQNTRGLCGFSHGAAGVGYVFLELGRYFQNDAFYWMAEQAFAYEAVFFDISTMNWPDFRKGVFGAREYEEHRKAYLDGNIDFFIKPGQMNAWCHGAAGIGLSRLKAFELLQIPIYETEAKYAIECTAKTVAETNHPYRTFTLCHGGCGNAELFLEAYKIFRDKEYIILAEAMAQKALESNRVYHYYTSGYAYSDKNEDISLFMGSTGIGYFYLKLLEPSQIPSIQAPSVDVSKTNQTDISDFSFISITKDQIQRMTLEKLFPRVFCMMERIAPEKTTDSLTASDIENRDNIKTNFIGILNVLIASFVDSEQKQMADLLDLELEKIRVDEAVQSNAWLYIKDAVKKEQADKLVYLETNPFLNIRLKLERDVKLLVTSWNWNIAEPELWEENRALDPDEWPVLLKPQAERVMEKTLTPFLFTLLSIFQTEKKIKVAINELINNFDDITKDDRKEIEKAAIQQIKQALLAGMLVRRGIAEI